MRKKSVPKPPRRSLLARIKRVAENLYRDPKSEKYFGVKKIAGRRKVHSLDTPDRPTANRELKAWLAALDASDTQSSDRKLEAHLATFLAGQKGKAPGIYANVESIAKRFRATFAPGMSVAIRKIRTSDLLKWITTESAGDGEERAEWSASYFNMVRLFLRALFDLAVADRVIDEATNPFQPRLIKARKRGKTVRRIPTLAQFEAILESVRAQRDNHLREEGADFLAFRGLAGVGQAETAALWLCDMTRERIKFKQQKTGKHFEVPVYAWLVPLVEKLQHARNGASPDSRVFKIDDARKAQRCMRQAR